MATAKECDICGKLYKNYNTGNSAKKPNGLRFLNIDNYRSYYSHDIVEFCPECMAATLKFIKSLKGNKGDEKQD